MTSRSQRLKRIQRKYALDLDRARISLAAAQREHLMLLANKGRLRLAQSALEPSTRVRKGQDLACYGEWTARLGTAVQDLEPAIRNAEAACASNTSLLRLAQGRVDYFRLAVDQAQFDEEEARLSRATVHCKKKARLT